MPSKKKIISYDYQLLKKRIKRLDSHLIRVLLLYAQRNTCLFSFFLHSLSDRCQNVTGTYKTNALSLLGIFSIIQSPFTPLSANLSLTNFNVGILTLAEIKWSSVRAWPNNFSNSSKLSRLLLFSEKNSVCSKSVLTTASHLFARIRLTSLLPGEYCSYFPIFSLVIRVTVGFKWFLFYYTFDKPY